MIGLPVDVEIVGGSILLAIVLIVVGLVVMALRDLASAEIRGWIEIAPQAVLRLAAARLPAGQRETVYQEEWLPELTCLLRGTESRPITRLCKGFRFALGLFWSAPRVGRHISRSPAAEKPAGTVVDLRTGRVDYGIDLLLLDDGDQLHTYEVKRYKGSAASLQKLMKDEGWRREVWRIGDRKD
jgi:hypothetical protein